MYKIKPNDVKVLRHNVYLINNRKEPNVSSTEFELDFEHVRENRKTVKETVTAQHQVRGDMVQSDDLKEYKKINITKETEGVWDFE